VNNTSQNGVTRPQGAHCDIGAYEFDGIFYTKTSADGTGDCSSWANACTLQTALTSAVSGEEIWAAAGTYKPTAAADRSATFQLKNGVAVFGGFAGTETSRDERDLAANPTILSGDIDNDDIQTPIITDLSSVTGNTTNSYHVVKGATGATLDGFTITAGYADGNYPDYSGGGMYNFSSSPTVTNVTFSGNSGHTSGGGMYNSNGSSPTLTNVTFSANWSHNGGGMRNFANSSPTLMNVTLSGNSASEGGGMSNSLGSSPTLTNVTFNTNSATIYGGGMYNDSSSPTLTNVTFSANSATIYGGGMHNLSSSPTILNTILWSNTAPSGGAQIYNDISTPSVSNSVVQGGCPAGSTCTNIISDDPNLGTLGDHGGFTQTIPLLPGSSAINAGNDPTCATTDQRGITRPQGEHCDIGAYESDFPTVVSSVRANADPTTAANVNFSVTFSESVTGVDISDFILNVSSLTGALVTGVSGSGATYTVTVGTGIGTGTIRLDVNDDDSIVDAVSNPLGGAGLGNGNFTGGETYTINNPVPTTTSMIPSGATAGGAAFILTVNGTNFVNGSVVRWNGSDRTTTYVSSTSLTAAIPAANITVVGVQLVTVFNSAPGGGTSNGLPFFITTTGAPVTGYDMATGSNPTAGFGGVTAITTGNGTLVVAQYASNPGGTPTFAATGQYYDVHIAPPGAFTQVIIQFCGLTTSDTIYFWNGIGWVQASNQTYAAGCWTVTVNAGTVPTLTDLGGAVFGVGHYIYIDTTAPSVVSSVRADPNPTTAASVRFTVTFSESVTSVDTADFTLTVTGVTGASVTNVSGGPTAYTVNVNTGTGSGTLRINVVDNDSIKDGSGNPLGGVGAGNA